MIQISVFIILSILGFTQLTLASSDLRCEYLLILNKKELENRIISIAKEIVLYQKNLNSGVKTNQEAYLESIRQLDQITKSFPDMAPFYFKQYELLNDSKSSIDKKSKQLVERDKIINSERNLDNISFVEIDGSAHLILKMKSGNYLSIGPNESFNKYIAGLQDVKEMVISKGHSSIIVVKNDNTISTWENFNLSGLIQNISNVKKVVFSGSQVAILSYDGKVQFVGNSVYQNYKQIPGQLENIQDIIANRDAFAILKNDRTVETFGSIFTGGNSADHLVKDLKDIVKVYPVLNGFIALRDDQRIVFMNSGWPGFYLRNVSDFKVKDVFSNNHSVAILTDDGRVITWGDNFRGGDSSKVKDHLINIKTIVSSENQFVALSENNVATMWGNNRSSDLVLEEAQLKDIVSVYATENAFAGIKKNGAVVTWGTHTLGGDSSEVAQDLHNIIQIFPLENTFVALRADNKLVVWGRPIGDYENAVINIDIY